MSRPTAAEAPALPVVAYEAAWLGDDHPVARVNIWSGQAHKLVRLSDAQAALDKLTAERDTLRASLDALVDLTSDTADQLRQERDEARALAASHSDECEKWAAMHQRSKAQIAALASQAESEARDAAWQPISTAPMDRTEILLWRPDCGQFIGSYTSGDAFPLTQDEIDSMDEEVLFQQDWFTQWPDARRLEGSEAPTLWRPLPEDPGAPLAEKEQTR